MVDKKLDTIWDMQPHTQAKHRILQGYLGAWFQIIGTSMPKAERALYVDGFAGPGRYVGGEVGSPIVAVEAARVAAKNSKIPLRLVFIEEDRARCDHLNQALHPHRQDRERPQRLDIRDPIRGDCEEQLSRTLDRYEAKGKSFGPALVFLDQFGYSDVSLDLIRRLMSHKSCEVFTYLHADGILRFINDPAKESALTKAFGGDAWRIARTGSGNVPSTLASIYRQQLVTGANVQFVWTFAMHGDGGRLLYWLFFCTNSLKGLREMKMAMLRVDDTGDFRFSDSESPDQMILFSAAKDDAWLEDHLSAHFAGNTVTVHDVNVHVLTRTPRVHYKEALQRLEKAKRLQVVDPPAKRRAGTFAEPSMCLHFLGSTTGSLKF
uniref:GMT-like wHTH domain-containing protein n=1 Tax=uncultured bacterium A1Q1_fos_91 TaxID=1256591 RepID=L7VR91_9BACT|nr:hypothetical protein [uncultured bacterium A1Q1_fos_91]